MTRKIIGIVGGVGPMAGLDLFMKIIEETRVASDQEHLPVLLHSLPSGIADRTEYLAGRVKTNPAFALIKILKGLKRGGATVAAIPCNTAHAPAIFDIIRKNSPLKLVHMIEETARFLKKHHPRIKRVGLLSTMGTYQAEVYPDMLVPDEKTKRAVHDAIYNRKYGIKAQSSPVTGRARSILVSAVKELERKGAQAVILGCTEIPLALTGKRLGRVYLIDPTRVLARALIREVA